MFIIDYDHTTNQNSFNSERDLKHAYACKLEKFEYDEKGLKVGFRFTPSLPKQGKHFEKVLGISQTYTADLTRNQFNEVRSRILAHKVISFNLVEKIIEDVQAGK